MSEPELLSQRSAIENGETVTVQTWKRKDGTTIEQTVDSRGWVKRWHQLKESDKHE